MKNYLLLLCCAGFLCAQPYSIFAGTFKSEASLKNLENFRADLEKKLSSNPNVDGVQILTEDPFKCVVVKTKNLPSKQDANLVVKDVRNYVSDAFIANPAAIRDMLKSQIKKAANQSNNEIKKEQVNKVSHSAFTINKAVEGILIDNPKMKEAIARYLQTGKDLQISKNAFYPTLDLAAAYGYRYDSRKYIKNSTKVHDDDVNGYAKLVLNQNLFNGTYDINGVAKQNHRMDAAAFYVNQTADRLVLDSIVAYINILKDQALLNIAKQNLKSHKQIHSQIHQRTSSGYSRISDEKQAGSRLTLAEANLLAQENNLNDSITTFYKLSGKNVNPENLVMPTFNHKLPNSVTEVYDTGVKCNPTVLLQGANVEVAKSAYDQSKSPFMPKLDLEATAGYDNTNEIYDGYKENKEFTAMLKMNYNLFNKGQDRLSRQKAGIAIQEEQENKNSLIRDLSESVRFSWESYSKNTQRLPILEKHLKYAEQTLRTYRDEFRLGRRDLINLLDAETEYFNAVREIIITKNELLIAKYRILDNMGMLTNSFISGFSKKYTKKACDDNF